MARRGVTAAGLVVAGHLLTSAAHGIVHGVASVPLAGFQRAFVVVVVGIAPVVAFGLLVLGHSRIGTILLAASLAGSLCFGVAFHFLLSTPDHVHAVAGRWRVSFGATASLAAFVDAVGLGVVRSSVVRNRDESAPVEP